MTLEAPRNCRSCQASIRLARSAATGAWFALDPTAVPAGTRGALVLVGDVAFSEASGVAHMAETWALDEYTARDRLRTDYTWHFPHKVTCKGGQ
jgi:hypothetical protein